ncbi:MAG: DUF3575 domain-containing protein [Bacteroidales bacterium]|nr:DUF3575 domain-containing protein [Bacteroidales bacterium]
MKIKCFLFLLIFSVFKCLYSDAQSVALKTNLVYDATANANLAVEMQVAPKWTVELSGNLNLWKFSEGKQWRNYVVQPEVRYWLCDTFSGHFFGAHLFGGQYNIGKVDLGFSMLGTDFSKLKDMRYQGWFTGLGVAYGYDWIINRHWNVEAEIGIGWAYTRFDSYPCAHCGSKIDSDRPHNYFGPTKLAVNIEYLF